MPNNGASGGKRTGLEAKGNESGWPQTTGYVSVRLKRPRNG